MIFVPFTGVDNHWKNVTFGAGLLAKENYKNFKWLLRSFKKAMGRVPSTVITDQCKAIKKALSKWWSSSNHRLCMWHIMSKLPAKVIYLNVFMSTNMSTPLFFHRHQPTVRYF